ncbi:hypothetical protein BDW75DRAFT_162782 [Aspergillus navahoensis]
MPLGRLSSLSGGSCFCRPLRGSLAGHPHPLGSYSVQQGLPLRARGVRSDHLKAVPKGLAKIFGPIENKSLPVEIVPTEVAASLVEQINQETGQNRTPAEIAERFHALTEALAYETSPSNLACFGGAGDEHACTTASSLPFRTVIIRR